MLKNVSDNTRQDDFLFNTSSETRLIKKNKTIYRANQSIREVYIILEGQAESLSEDNKNTLTLGKGSVLGLMDTILNRNYSKDIIAKTAVVLAIINKNKIDKSLKKNMFQTALIKSLAIDIDNNKPNTWS